MLTTEINNLIDNFLNVFNDNDLDQVMTFFSDEAVYEPGDGRTHKGKLEIRAAFEPQFAGALGKMKFDETDRVIDAENGKAVIRWICRHNISDAKPRGLYMSIQKVFIGLFIGEKFGWRGLDVFHFDADGKIKGKFTYAWYGSRPYIQRELG